MIDRRKYISYLLIRDIINTSSGDIPDDRDFSNKVQSNSIKQHASLSIRSDRSSCFSKKRNPTKSLTMSKTLYTT